MTATTDRLPFTGDDEADRLLVANPLALLIGFALDQQVTVQKAFSGPAELQRRLGHLDAAKIAATDPTVKRARVTISIRGLPNWSPSRPSSGVATDALSR